MEQKGYQHNPDRVEVHTRAGGYIFIPAIWFYGLMLMEDGTREARRVDSSFWKFLIKLWHEIMFNRGRKKSHWTAELYMDQFHVHPDAASKWTIALKNSRLFKVQQAPPRYPRKEPITFFQYNTQCTATDWIGFYNGLMAACAEIRGKKWPGAGEWGRIVLKHVETQTEEKIDIEGGVRAPKLL